MLTLRRIWTVLVGAWVASFTVKVLCDWILGLDDTIVLALAIGAALLGGLASLDEARSVEPWTLWDERDAYLGWITVLGVVAVIACFFLPMPYGGVAAGAVAAVTIVVLRKAPGGPPGSPPERPRA